MNRSANRPHELLQEVAYVYGIAKHLFLFTQGCSLLIREDLLNKYSEQIFKYCTVGLNNMLQDELSSTVQRLHEKEQEILQLEIKLWSVYSELLAYKEKLIAHEMSHVKRLHEEKCKYRKLLFCFQFVHFKKIGQVCMMKKIGKLSRMVLEHWRRRRWRCRVVLWWQQLVKLLNSWWSLTGDCPW